MTVFDIADLSSSVSCAIRCSISARLVRPSCCTESTPEMVSIRSRLVFSSVSMSMMPRCDCFSISIAWVFIISDA